MAHKYGNRRLDLKQIQYLRWAIPDLEVMLDVVPHWAKEMVRLRIDEHKTLYQELHPSHLPYKSIEELRRAIDEGVAHD